MSFAGMHNLCNKLTSQRTKKEQITASTQNIHNTLQNPIQPGGPDIKMRAINLK